MYNSFEYDEMIRAVRKRERRAATRPMTPNEYRCCDNGANPKTSSFEAIFEAYRDYRSSQQWN
jgi:hypothetical protein